ncbi:uncharacterized protein LOC127242986 [Andrographis paniculata]|uniref:uncharacterized protein LOC127242986 n=1 Tax=Andrographis paniculata TaxID=175694 RepID=UPI0021E81A76|nr:uncharacterized protein LOC127242986 [Andrographis paniculata]
MRYFFDQAKTKSNSAGVSPMKILDAVRDWKVTGRSLLQSLDDLTTDFERREQSLASATESMEARLKDLEKKEKELEKKKTELVLKEKEHEKKKTELALKEKEHEKKKTELALKEKELEKKKTELVSKEKEHENKKTELVLKDKEQENKKTELVSKEKEHEKKKTELAFLSKDSTNSLRLKEQKLDEQLKSVSTHIDSLENSRREVQNLKHLQCEKLKEIEEKVREVELMRVAMEERMAEIEREFDRKLRELALKEEFLETKRAVLVGDVKLADERFRDGKKKGWGLMKKMESALCLLEGTQATIDEKLKKSELCAREGLIVVLDEAELIGRQLEKHFTELERISKEDERERRNSGIDQEKLLKEIKLMDVKVAEHQKLGEKIMDRLEEVRAKKVTEMVDYGMNRELVDLHLQELKKREEEFHLYQREREEELVSKEKKLRSIMEEFIDGKFDKQEINEMLRERLDLVWGCTEPEVSVDSKQAKDVSRLLETAINSEKDAKLVGDDVSEVLRASSDPAKLVLDAMKELCVYRAMRADRMLNLRRIRILLLRCLSKMSRNIKPCVRQAVIRLAEKCEPKTRNFDENPLQMLEYLLLMAAYKLRSPFNNNDVLSFLKAIAQHEETPELFLILGLRDKIEEFVQNLINEKRYLLASSYIKYFEVERVFPQTAVIDYYVKHVKILGKVKLNDPFEAQLKASFEEIRNLRQAIEHIVKHGLQYAYAPELLMERIGQLEQNLKCMGKGLVISLSPDVNKPHVNKPRMGCENLAGLQNASGRIGRMEQENQDNVDKEDLEWKYQSWESRPKKCRAPTPQEKKNARFRRPNKKRCRDWSFHGRS